MNQSKIKSIAIKVNNSSFLDYLYLQLLIQSKNHKKIYISKNNFKNYSNIIIHHSSILLYDDLHEFIDLASDLLTTSIIKFYTYPLLQRQITLNYFYFTLDEQINIIHNTINSLNTYIFECYSNIYPNIYLYLYNILEKSNHCSLYLTGFVNFRLKKFMLFLQETLEKEIQKYILQKEYLNFIHILKEYVSTIPCSAQTINVIFSKETIKLLDSKYNPIKNTNIKKDKFLSDIYLSNNDNIIDTLLNLSPKQIIIHILFNKNNIYNDLINTLELIFEDKVSICNNCSLCKTYMHNKK